MPQFRLGLLLLGLAASPFAVAQTDIRPGLWDMSVEFSVPADPAFKQPAISRPQCLTAADARDPSRLLAEMSVPGATGCDWFNVTASSARAGIRTAREMATQNVCLSVGVNSTRTWNARDESHVPGPSSVPFSLPSTSRVGSSTSST